MKTIFFFIVTIIMFFLSCSSIKEGKFRTSSVILNEIHFKDKKFKDLIIKSVEDFRKKNSNIKNSVVIFEISYKDSTPLIYLTNYFYFKTGLDEGLDFGNSYEGGFINNGILIISNKNFYSHPNIFYKIKRKKKKFNYIVGNNIDFCTEEFELKNGIFNKIKHECSNVFFTD